MGVASGFQPEWETHGDFLEWLQHRGLLLLNFVPLSAHGPIRIALVGAQARLSTPDELKRMKELVRRVMEAGCRGFFTSLTYFPGMYAHTDELVDLVQEAGKDPFNFLAA